MVEHLQLSIAKEREEKDSLYIEKEHFEMIKSHNIIQ
jgi:hypothetical protein